MNSILVMSMLKLHSIGPQIASRRKALGITQSALADKAGVSRQRSMRWRMADQGKGCKQHSKATFELVQELNRQSSHSLSIEA
jgi:transcriptional regulator with XRE-family HTH domain